ncbi:MAG: SPOR domain-containing protein [Christensenellales bacterium]|jgi:N-acetylmuramoyl-L-alanine amidase
MPKIYLSPSTQEANHCQMGDTEEQHCNRIMDLIVPYLEAAGIEYQRNTPQMTHISSKDASNAYKPELHYALHSNATGTSKKIRRHIVYCLRGGKAEQFAQILCDKQAEIYPEKNEIQPPYAKLTEIYYTNAPSVIDEIAFHDQIDDAKWIHDNIAAIARNKAQAICQFFGVPFVELDAQAPDKDDGVWYRVQAGAFKQKGNAERLRDTLRDLGYGDTFVQDDPDWYRVQVGAFKERANAEKLRKELMAKGYTDVFIR